MLKLNKKGALVSPSLLTSFISSEYGIKVDIKVLENRNVIKVYNHLSLFSIIGKIRRNFDFSVHHKKENNEYLIVLERFVNE
jgi:hypothetical protein